LRDSRASQTTKIEQNAKLQYAVLAAAAVHGGTEPDLLGEVASWQADDFWQYAMYAAVAYIRAAASGAGVPVRQACQDLHEPPAWDHGTIVAAAVRRGTPGERVAARLAEATGDLLADPAIGNVRECAGADCVLLFLPGHPRRQWCSAARCGNRARVARYYQHHKTAR
jgi:hypothetical protein